MWLTAVCIVFLALLVPAPLAAGSNSTTHHWQEGEILSRKTVPVGHGGLRYRYVYRLRGRNARYIVASDEPLKLDLMVPVKFAPLRRHLLIQDSEGKEYKVWMMERDKREFGRWK
jgi:hypothetical protein